MMTKENKTKYSREIETAKNDLKIFELAEKIRARNEEMFSKLDEKMKAFDVKVSKAEKDIDEADKSLKKSTRTAGILLKNELEKLPAPPED